MTKQAWLHEQYKQNLGALTPFVEEHAGGRVVGIEHEYAFDGGVADACITIEKNGTCGVVLAEVKAGKNRYAWKRGVRQLQQWYRRSGRHARRVPDRGRRPRAGGETGVDAL